MCIACDKRHFPTTKARVRGKSKPGMTGNNSVETIGGI